MSFQQKRIVSEAKRAVAAGKLAEARSLCERALKKDRRDVEALELLGVLALEQGVLDEAATRFRKCAALRPQETRYQYRLGQVLHEQGSVREALKHFEVALRHGAEPHIVLARAAALERIGEHAEARATLAPLVEQGAPSPSTTGLWARLLVHAGELEAAIAVLRERLDEPGLSSRDRQALLFVLGRALEKAERHDEAFEACAAANAIDRPAFDAKAYVDTVDRIIRTFTEPVLSRLARAADRSPLPVIVAGMPRSGTTLVEQIVDAHPRATGAGELIHLPRLVGGLQLELDSYEPYPECLEDMTPAQASSLGRAYLAVLRAGRRVERIVDKTLDNFELLGLISLLTPGARVLACRRDPLDTCLSCYLNHLVPQRFPWVTDLRSLATVYRQHERLMEHWRSVLDLPVHEVCYETLVDDPEPSIRAIIDACGLDWDDRCLQFHESRRAVMTLSYDQVMRPMYRTSVGRWKRFEKHLGPLIDALAAPNP